ncbi:MULTISPECIES: hypothetical protein [Yersiniaceae]|nr:MULTISPECIES: hypothetical protein [Yersiniaceae]MDV5139185.1 hypothetical protein [Chimaeribacter arupi]WKZ94147.1 hypothetical protein P0E69_09870 [Chimaeribacter arupi]
MKQVKSGHLALKEPGNTAGQRRIGGSGVKKGERSESRPGEPG